MFSPLFFVCGLVNYPAAYGVPRADGLD